MAAWLDALGDTAPDVVACFRALGDGTRLGAMRRELRRRGGPGSAARVERQQDAVADALAAALRGLPEAALRLPGNEADWNVAQTFAHTTAARRWLARAAALAATDRWPADPPRVIPGIPGPADATPELLLTLLDKSRRSLAESAAQIAGRESVECPLDHPLVGRLRCGEWLVFVGVHDLMHLEQLNDLAQLAERSSAAGN